MTENLDRDQILVGYARARETFRRVTEGATTGYLGQRSRGTRWTNRQLLFHMVFGYLIVYTLRWIVRLGGLLPRWASRGFSALLNLFTGPFNVANYVGSVIGGRVFTLARMESTLEWTTRRLATRLATESDRTLARGMHFPPRWDPFFKDYLTLAELYRYPTQHFEFHADQLS